MKTLTNLQILNAAYSHILNQWAIENDRYERGRAEGMEMPIAKHHADRYWSQLEELHAAIIEEEKANA